MIGCFRLGGGGGGGEGSKSPKQRRIRTQNKEGDGGTVCGPIEEEPALVDNRSCWRRLQVSMDGTGGPPVRIRSVVRRGRRDMDI